MYTSLVSLKNSELIDFIDGNKNHIKLHSPERISNLIKLKQAKAAKAANDFDEYLPDILTRHSNFSNKSIVQTYQGSGSIIKAILEVSDNLEYCEGGTKNKAMIFGEGEDFYSMSGVWEALVNVWLKNRKKEGVDLELLIKSDNRSFEPMIQLDREHLRETKYLPDKIKSNGCFWVYKNHLLQWDTALNQVIYVKDKAIADMHTQLFEMTWDSL